MGATKFVDKKHVWLEVIMNHQQTMHSIRESHMYLMLDVVVIKLLSQWIVGLTASLEL